LQTEFPGVPIKELHKRLKVFSSELNISGVTDHSAFVLTERAYKKIFRSIEKVDSDDYKSLELGINGFVSLLNIKPKHELVMQPKA
jgi:hypothetical protein